MNINQGDHMLSKYVTVLNRNILESKEDFICHQVNCKGVMGAGVARALYEKWPQVKSEYLSFYRSKTSNCKSQQELEEVTKSLLGQYQLVEINKTDFPRYVVNIFSQYGYGRNECHTDYPAISRAINFLFYGYPTGTYAFPYGFGCGLAGGDWDTVFHLIGLLADKHQVYCTFYRI